MWIDIPFMFDIEGFPKIHRRSRPYCIGEYSVYGCWTLYHLSSLGGTTSHKIRYKGYMHIPCG